MLSVRRNAIANVAGQLTGILTSLLVVPVYARTLGDEGFGVVGLVASLQAMSAMFDLGFSATANREVSRSSVHAGARVADVVRTLEYIYLGTGSTIFLLLLAGAGWVSRHWIVATELSPTVLSQALSLAAIVVAFRFSQVLYHGVLRGLEQQVFLNIYLSVSAVIQSGVLVCVLVLWHAELAGFLLAQATLSVLDLVILRGMALRMVTRVDGRTGRFSLSVLRGLWKYAAGVNLVTVLATGVKQVDKVLLSKLMPIQFSGYYSAATLVGTGIGKMGVPLQVAVFPRMSRLVAVGDWQALEKLLRQSVRATGILAATAGCAIAWFAHDVLIVWTGSQSIAEGGSAALSIVAAAMVLNCVMGIVFGLILAAGAISISLFMNLGGLLAMLPMTYVLIRSAGVGGAALSWLGFNVAYYLIVPWLVARRIPAFRAGNFYLIDTLPYLLGGAAYFGVVRWAASGCGPWPRVAIVIVASGVFFCLAVWSTRDFRSMATGMFRRILGQST